MITEPEATVPLPGGDAAVHSSRLVTSLEQAAASPASLDLAGLVEAVRRGDEGAFPELYQRLAPAIHDYLIILTGDRATAEDLLQQTFLEAWRGLASLREPSKVRTWLYGIARHAGQEHLRSRTTPVPLDGVPDLEVTAPGPEDAVLSDDAARLVWTAAASLEPNHQEALSLHLRHGLTYREIGDLLGLAPARANDLLIRSREALGRAVRSLFVARSSAACRDLHALAPGGADSLTVEQRRAVDHHLRLCDECHALGLRLTRPEELFGAVVLATLPATAQHAPAIPAAGLGSARLAAAHSADPGFRAAAGGRSLRRRARGLGDRRRLLTGGAALALLVAATATVGSNPVAPPTSSPPDALPAPIPIPATTSLWEQGVQDVATLTSYTLSWSTSGSSIDIAAFDITVGPPGSWFGSVTASSQPGYPLTFADENGGLYVQGGPDFVAVAPDFFSLTTAQAQSLGNGWLSLDAIGSEGTVLDRAITPYTLPYDLALLLPLPVVTPSGFPTTVGGQAATQLRAGDLTIDVTTGGSAYPLQIDDAPDSYTLGAFNRPVTPPDVSGAITWSQLTGGSPPP